VADLNSKLSAAGLRRNMTFVIYDNTSASFGAAGRIFWMLEYLGCNDVHILDGGWDKWVADGRPTEAVVNTLAPAKFRTAVKKSRRATKDLIAKKLGTKNFAVVDSRTDEEYNGWQLYGEARGGHIPGAVQIPYEWFFNADKTVLDYADLKKMFESRGITKNKQVTAYCTSGIRSGFVYFLYRLMGYPKASNYDASIVEWAADDSLPMDKLSNYSKLVYPQWVKDLIDGKSVPNPPAGRYIIVAAKHTDDETGYIPGSIIVTADDEELYPTTTVYGSGDLWPNDVLKANIENLGIDKDTTVIVYHQVPGGNPLFATRVLWALMYAGVSDVRLLNGGIDAWMVKGFGTNPAPAEKVPVVSFGTAPGEFPLHPEYLATTGYVEEVVAGQHPDAVLADIRSWTEYIGGPNDYLSIGIPMSAVGRITGAEWGHWGPSTLEGGDFWDSYDNTLRSYPEVKALWDEWGIASDKTVSFY
jgi:3-mercaptopyruvate sulfurtransferase SseA